MSDDEGKWAWHIHHDQLVECLDDGGLEARADFIRNNKPAGEVPTRLRLLKVVQDVAALDAAVARLTAARVTAARAIVVAGEVDNPTHKAHMITKAYIEAIDLAYRVYLDAINVLHAKECPNCPWDGKTIFPKAAM